MPAVLPRVALFLTLALTAACSDAEDTAAPAPAATSRGSDPSPTTSPTTPTSTTTPAAAPTPSASSAAPAPGTLVATYAGGKVTGLSERTRVAVGDTITLRVTSDVADEIHVHGYDEYADVAPGAPATLTFTANIPGVFEVELEGIGALLTRLQVQ